MNQIKEIKEINRKENEKMIENIKNDPKMTLDVDRDLLISIIGKDIQKQFDEGLL